MAAKYFVFDIDGTLADGEHRQHHLTKDPNKKDWDSFFKDEEMIKDKVHNAVAEIYSALRMSSDMSAGDEEGDWQEIIFLTARPERTREVTKQWLHEKIGVFEEEMDELHLLMRPDGERKDDTILKPEMLDKLGKENVICVFEDRNRIIKALRAAGYIAIHVADGDF